MSALRRAGTAALALSLGVSLAACGAGDKKPSAAPTKVDTGIPLPSEGGATTFAGQGLSQVQLTKISKQMSTALQKGDEKGFLAYIAPGKPRLRAQQTQWFRNVRKMPMKMREIVVVRPDNDIDSSGKGTLTAFVGFKHEITGADARPITEWYNYGFKLANDQLKIVSVGGAPAEKSSGKKFSRYYRQSWDDPGAITFVQDDKVVLIGPAEDEAAMKRLLPAASDGVRAAIDTFVKGGAALKADVKTRKWVFNLADGEVEDFFDYYGGTVDPREADFAAFAQPIIPSVAVNDASLDYEYGMVSTRIVLNRSNLGYSSDSFRALVRHEMVHGLQQTWEDPSLSSVPTWLTEGLATYLSDPPASELAFRKSAGRQGLAGAKAMPTTEQFYAGDNDAVSRNYGMGLLAVGYLVDEVGLKKVLAGVKKFAGEYKGNIYEEVGVPEKGFVAAVKKWAGA